MHDYNVQCMYNVYNIQFTMHNVHNIYDILCTVGRLHNVQYTNPALQNVNEQ